ncbi:hypothetical protein SmJEL517_g04854 [Synchytrium microbalum]|uniref:MYND-type domain-containing protein n=1 Tax=Synchytrium microbalum TaxID=1806994 RepID=A0A507C2Y8_9FUNG|nr:uncharacterized protein SmJEL517_g04854 [Synchytrium microbalum]TPX31905.1 hypothetical protein SmJEL517_g04854 [Synchytrium microbalum]
MSNDSGNLDQLLSDLGLALHPDIAKHRKLTTKVARKPAQVILRDDALAISSSSSYICHACLVASSATLLVCARCKSARYCSKKCQASDWKSGHKLACQLYVNYATDHDIAEADLLIKAIYKSDEASKSVAWMSFSKLMDHANEFDDETTMEMKQTIDWVSQVSSHGPSDMMTYLGRFKSNNYAMYDPDLNIVGEGCFALAALLNHSCHPNLCIEFEGRGMVVRCMTELTSGDELLVSYQDPMTPGTRRRLLLKENFDCTCIRCVKPDPIIPALHGGFPYVDTLLTDADDPIDLHIVSNLIADATNMPSYIPIFNNPNPTPPISPPLISYISTILPFMAPVIPPTSSQTTYLTKHHEIITTFITTPSDIYTLPTFIAASTLLTNQIESGKPQWLDVAILAMYAASTYLLVYERYHPMVGLKFLLAGKALFNAAEDAKTQPELRSMVLDAQVLVKLAKECLAVSHGYEGANGRVMKDVEEVEKAILIELS